MPHRVEPLRAILRPSADRGSTTTELTIAFPVVLLVVMLTLQFALHLHAAQIAEAAAHEAVEAAQGEHATAADGHEAATTLLAQVAGLRQTRVSVDRTAEAVTASVRGRAQQLVPGAPVAVSAVAHGPVERFVPEPPS